MNGYDVQTLQNTYGSGTLQNTIPYQNNIYDSGYNWVQWYPHYQRIEVEPTKCMGKAHVFECDHVEACQCGKIARVMPKPAKENKR